MSTGIRKPIYFSKDEDEDLINYFKQFKKKKFARVARSLMRDGIEYRKEQRAKRNEKVEVLQSNTLSHKVTLEENKQSNQQSNFDFSNVQLKEKQVDDKEIEDKLDNF